MSQNKVNSKQTKKKSLIIADKYSRELNFRAL